MTNQINAVTTGTPPVVTIDGLGGIILTDPETKPLVTPTGSFEYSEVVESIESTEPGSLGALYAAGEITLEDDNGNQIVPGSNNNDFVKTTGDESIEGTKTFNDPTVIGDAGFASPYLLSIQDQDNDGFAYIEILSNRTGSSFGGANKGAFFGMEDWGNSLVEQEFALYNYQGGGIVFWTDTSPSSSIRRLQIENDGTISIPGALGGFPGTANYELLVTDDNDIPNKKFVDDAIAAASGTGALQFEWRFSTSLSGDPGSGRYGYDNVLPASVTEIRLSDVTNNGVDINNVLDAVEIGDRIYLQTLGDSTSFILGSVNAAPVDNLTYWSFPVTVEDSGFLPSNNSKGGGILVLGANTIVNLGTTVSASQVEITNTAGDNALLTASTATLAGILTAQAQTIGGEKTFVDDLRVEISGQEVHRLGTNGADDGQITITDNAGGEQLQLTSRPTGAVIVAQGVTREINYWALDHLFRLQGNTASEIFQIENVDNDGLFLAEGDGRLRATFPSYETLIDADNVLTTKKFLDDGFVHKTGSIAESIDGVKTFIEDSIFIDAPSASATFELGFFTDITPNCYGIRQDGLSGYFCYMPNADNPQLVLGSPTMSGSAFIDCENSAGMFINQLNTGPGVSGNVTIGAGGLTVGSNDATFPNLSLTSVTGGTFWNIYLGSPGNFDDWLRFSAVGSSAFNEAVLLPDGVWRVRDGVAGSPSHGFIDFSNYGMFMNSSYLGSPALGFSTLGTPRFYLRSTGELNVPAFGEGVVVSDSQGDLSVQVFPDRQVNQSLVQQTIVFGAGTTPYVLIPDSAITTANTVNQDYELTANFSSRTVGSNNRTLQFAIFVDTVETVTFEVTRYDQQNDDKSITIRWELTGIAPGTVIDWRVRNINASIDWQVNRRNFTIEQFSFN